jgi:hypothetical protein
MGGGQIGTTVSGTVLIGNSCLFFNVGDSRTYLINAGGIRQVTRDHSADMEALKNGIITEDEIGQGYYSHALTRSVGTDPNVEVDILPENKHFHILQEGDVIVSCTDGLWNVVTEQEIYREILGRKSIEKSLEALASLAHMKNSKDNISIAALEYGRIPRKKSNLEDYIPVKKLEQKANPKRNILLPILLAVSITAFLVVVGIVIFKMNSGSNYSSGNNQSQQIKPNTGRAASAPISDPGVKGYKPESRGGNINFSTPGGRYIGTIQIKLDHENLRSSRDDEITSEIYYTQNGPPPTRNYGKKYLPGEKIVLNRPGQYIIKAKLFAKTGTYESDVYEQKYLIVRKPEPPKTVTVKIAEKLDPRTRQNIFSNTKNIMIDAGGINRLKRKGIVKILISISKKGLPKVIEISGIQVFPESQLEEIRINLNHEIQNRYFEPPTSEGKPVRVEIWLDFKRVSKFRKKIKLER